MADTGRLLTLSFDGTSLIDDTNYFTVISNLDSEAEQDVPILKGIHTRPAAGIPTLTERVLVAECFVVPASNAGYTDFDSKLESLKQVLDTTDGTKQLIMQRRGFAARYLNCYTRQFAINRVERKFSWEFVAPDPIWRSVTLNSDSQSITTDGQTWSLTNTGSHMALPIFTVTPVTANTGTWNYHRRIILRNPMTETAIPEGYWYDITGGGLDTATLVSGSKMQSGGDDVRVVFRGEEIPRYLQNMNTASTKIWIRFPSPLPKATVDGLGGEWSDDGTNLAPGTSDTPNDVTGVGTINGNSIAKNVIATTFDNDGNPDEPLIHNRWVVTGTTGRITIDLGAQYTINRVRILHLPNNRAAANYTVQTSANNIAYTTQNTITGNTTQGKYTTHDFSDLVTCRYVRVDITSSQGASKVGLNKIMIFRAHHHLTLRYGNSTADAPHYRPLLNVNSNADSNHNPLLPIDSIAFQPMFDPSVSTNYLHVYDEFTDDTPQGKFRTMQWERRNHYKDPLGKAYKGGQSSAQASPSGSPSDSVGVTQVNAGVGHADTWQIYEPCGVRGVAHVGDVKNTVRYYAWRQLSKSKSDHTPVQDWEWSYPVSNWTYYSYFYTSYTAPDEIQTKYYILFNLHRYGADPSGTKHYGQVRLVNLQLVTTNVPVCTLQAENGANVSLDFSIVNTSTTNQLGFSVDVENIPLGESIVIDCYNKTITRSDTGKSLLPSLKLKHAKQQWFRLKPGANVLRWDEPGVSQVTVQTEWADSWV